MISIDSDVLIEILDRKSLKGDQALKQITESKEEVTTTVISLHEVLYGLHKYGKPVKELLLLPILSYTKKDAVLASKIEHEVEKKGKMGCRTDAMIAAITINNGAKLFTFNLKHFEDFREFGLELYP
ncbi:MAG TPA: type II toxin-antitoxin system VapC family toxin [Candidatus Bathyarchaeia archaeon]